MTAAVGAALEREHRSIDEGILPIANADPGAITTEQRSALLEAIAVLRRHIYFEEEYLFPPLRASGLVGPVMVMVHEHGLMWPLLDDLERFDDPDTAPELCRNLLEQLNSHNMKEERIVYPHADQTLSGQDLDELAEFLDTAELPAGWVCSGVAID